MSRIESALLFANTLILALILIVISHFVFQVFPASIVVKEHLSFMAECSKYIDPVSIPEGQSLSDIYISCAEKIQKTWFP